MKLSTVLLTLALLSLGGYAAFLKMENQRLRELALQAVDGRYAASVPSRPFSDYLPEAVEAHWEDDGWGRAGPQAQAAAGQPQAVEGEQGPRQGWGRGAPERVRRMAMAFSDPELRVDMVERQMNQIDGRYGAYFQTLNLNADQIDSLRTLMAERNVVGWESRLRFSGAQTDEERQAIEDDRRRQEGLVSQQIEALLGKRGHEELNAYTDSLPYRQRAQALAAGLSYSSQPLSAQQSEGLVRALQSTASEFAYSKDLSDMRRLRNVTQSEVDTFFAERAEHDSLVLAGASQALSRDQLAALAERQAADRERDERQMRFMLQNRGQGGGGPRER